MARTSSSNPVPRPRRHPRPTLEILEDRLTPSWAGIPPSQISIPSSPLAVTLNTLGDANGTGYNYYGEDDYIRFTARSTGSYVFTASASASYMDTVLGVFDASGRRLGFNDDVNLFNQNSQVTLNLVAGRVYYVGITRYTGEAGGGFVWSINGPSGSTTTPMRDDGFENNDTLSQATSLGVLAGTRTFNGLVMADAADNYRFQITTTATTANTASITFEHSRGDLDLEIYNAQGTLIRYSNGTSNREAVSLNGLPAGTYYARVYGYRGVTNPSYSLTIAAPTTVTPPPTNSNGFHIQVRFGTGLTTTQQNLFRQAAARWERIIIGDLPNATYGGVAVDDVMIDARGMSIDGVNGVLGSAGPDSWRQGTQLPIHGVMQFDSADLASLERSGGLLDVITHEMGHVLGIGTIWQARGVLAGAGTNNPRFTGRNAVAEYSRLTGRTETAVPVENTGGEGTAGGHWRETVFGRELMTGFLNSGVNNPISRMTAASLADIGYQVNLNAADAYALAGNLRSIKGSTTQTSSRYLVSDQPSGSVSTSGKQDATAILPEQPRLDERTSFVPTDPATYHRVTARNEDHGWWYHSETQANAGISDEVWTTFA